jgi:hypothetical protein
MTHDPRHPVSPDEEVLSGKPRTDGTHPTPAAAYLCENSPNLQGSASFHRQRSQKSINRSYEATSAWAGSGHEGLVV